MAHQAGAYPGFCSMKRLGVFLLPSPDGMLVHRRVTPSIQFAGTHLYTWVKRSTMSPARARTRAASSGVERANHGATAPPNYQLKDHKINLLIQFGVKECKLKSNAAYCQRASRSEDSRLARRQHYKAMSMS